MSSSFVSLSRFLCLDQVRREVIARLAPTQLKQMLEVIHHTKIESILFLDFGRAERCEIEQTSTRARTSMEDFPVVLRNTEHVADHGHRQPIRKIGDQVHVAVRLDAIDNVIDNGLNAQPHIFDPPRAERPHHEAAQAAVVGRIELQHPVAHTAVDRFFENFGPRAPGHATNKVLPEALVAQDRGDVSVAARDV